MDQAITLYFDLAPNTKVSLGTVAKASLAFDAAVKELSFFVDPTLEIDLEVDSGTAGSLKLNALIKSLRDGVTDRRLLKTVAVSAATWFALESADYVYTKALDEVFSHEEPHLSVEDKAEIAADVAKIITGRVGEREIAEVYRQAGDDKKVIGLGVGTRRNQRPHFVTPRTNFPSTDEPLRLLRPPSPQPDSSGEDIEEATLTLISPVLVRRHRRWKFHYRNEEFGATMLDEEFLDDVLNGREPIQLTAGIRMRVRMRTRVSEDPDGNPKVLRSILKVVSIAPGPRQVAFDFSPPPKAGESD